jgi:hypothetical protein
MAKDPFILSVNKKRDVECTESSFTTSYLVQYDPNAISEFTVLDLISSNDERLYRVGDLIDSRPGWSVTDRSFRQVENEIDLFEMIITCNMGNSSSNQTDASGFSRGRILSLDFDVMQYSTDAILGIYKGRLELSSDGSYTEYKANGDSDSILKYDTYRRLTDSAGRPFLTGTPKGVRNNLVMNLTYETNKQYGIDTLSTLALVCGSMNSKAIKIAGMNILAHQGKINKIKPILNKSGTFNVQVEIEIAICQPHYAMCLDEGIKKLGTAGDESTLTPILESEVFKVTQNPTLDITEPVPLNGKGGIINKLVPVNGDPVGVFLKYIPVVWFMDGAKYEKRDGVKGTSANSISSALMDWDNLIGPIPQ